MSGFPALNMARDIEDDVPYNGAVDYFRPPLTINPAYYCRGDRPGRPHFRL